MSALIKWAEGLKWWQQMLLLPLAFAAFNFATTGNWDSTPHETCIDNPRTNDAECWPDDGYTYDEDGQVVPLPVPSSYRQGNEGDPIVIQRLTGG